jgi:hypothetical protein
MDMRMYEEIEFEFLLTNMNVYFKYSLNEKLNKCDIPLSMNWGIAFVLGEKLG